MPSTRYDRKWDWKVYLVEWSPEMEGIILCEWFLNSNSYDCLEGGDAVAGDKRILKFIISVRIKRFR